MVLGEKINSLLGRGLRKMYADVDNTLKEYVSVVGTDAFMDFVESIQSEGIELERAEMGEGSKPKTPIIVEIDNENTHKDMDALDIEIPILTARMYRQYKNLDPKSPVRLPPALQGPLNPSFKCYS